MGQIWELQNLTWTKENKHDDNNMYTVILHDKTGGKFTICNTHIVSLHMVGLGYGV